MKKIGILLSAVFLIVPLTWATPWAIVVNRGTHTINTIDLGTTPPKIYGPFLGGSLGAAANGLLDVALSPDNKYAFISNTSSQEIYRVDISNPKNPILAGTLYIYELGPGDINISPDGNFGLVTGLGAYPKVFFFDPTAFTSYSTYTLQTSGARVSSAAVAANGTVILTDFWGMKIYFGRVNDGLTGLVSESSLATNGNPLNVAISPDGTTALVASWYYSLDVYQITGEGTVVAGGTPSVASYLPDSIDFSPDGKTAYVFCSNLGPDYLLTYKVNSPGNVSIGLAPAASLLSCWSVPLTGIELLAVAPNGLYAIAWGADACLKKNVQLINLLTFSTSLVATNNNTPTGVATFWGAVLAPNNLALTRIENNYIFRKEYVNRLTWQENTQNTFSIVAYRIYRKPQGSSDSAYELLAEVGPLTFSYDDRGVGRSDAYTYGVASVDEMGRESQKAVISNFVN